MNISTKTTHVFKDKVEELIKMTPPKPNGDVDYEKILKELYEYASLQSRNYIPEHFELVQEHNGTGMNNSQVDYNMVFLSAVLISWTVRMQGVKSNKGQCWAHNNCQDARKMHSKINDEWIGVIQETLDALKGGRPDQ
jgi:hypothetical protein